LLGSIQLVERRIARSRELSERDQRAIQVVSQQARRLRQMIDALLDVSRLEQGQLSITEAAIDMGLLVERVVQEVRPGLQQHTIESDTPAEPVIILGDELRLEQVLQNLIQNAIKYSPAGGTIEVALEHDATQVAVQVRDHGVGIPAAALPHLFERFYRVPDAVERHIQGAGIGLFVVKEIVTLHGGTVDVTSQEGVGSTFTIRLPLAEVLELQELRANERAIAVERNGKPTRARPSDDPVPSILVVDDDSAIRAMLCDVLLDEGYQVVSVANGQEALDYLHHHNGLPQLILLDLMMPVMTGWAFLTHQQQDTRLAAIPVVVISAGANLQKHALPQTPASVLTKPVDVDLLLATVEHFCQAK
jgi:CheY-like chemotaxis protein